MPNLQGLEQIEKFKRWLRSRRYSESTITSYCNALKSFLVFHREKSISDITNDDVIIYTNDYLLKNKLSASYQNQIVNAIKLYLSSMRETKIDIAKNNRNIYSRKYEKFATNKKPV